MKPQSLVRRIRAKTCTSLSPTIGRVVRQLAVVITAGLSTTVYADTTTKSALTVLSPVVSKSRARPPLLKAPLRLDRNQISVSGISSGAFMAVQLHVAHADWIRGAGVIAGGIWNCAEGDLQRSHDVCLQNPDKIDVTLAARDYQAQAKSGKIAASSHLNSRDVRIWIFSGDKDQVTRPRAAERLVEFYKLVAPLAQVRRASHPYAAHGFLTEDYGKPCGQHGLPWIIDCDHDQAGELLEAVLQPRPTVWKPRKAAIPANYFQVPQQAPPEATMADWADVYVPSACQGSQAKPCALHVALHGCQMSNEFIQRQFVENAGYNTWAEANGFVVLYPQVAKSPGNPLGCWDWFGYTQKDHVSQSAPQIRGLVELIKSL